MKMIKELVCLGLTAAGIGMVILVVLIVRELPTKQSGP